VTYSNTSTSTTTLGMTGWALVDNSLNDDDDEPTTGVREPRRPIVPTLTPGIKIEEPRP